MKKTIELTLEQAKECYGKDKTIDNCEWTLHQLWQDIIKANKPKPR